MNALFVYPRIPPTYWSFGYALDYLSKKAAFAPLGLLTVAAMVPQGWNRRLVDLNVRDLGDGDLAWADYAFVSAMSVQRDSCREVIERCVRHGVRVVAGGPLFTSDEDAFPGVDHLVLGEAEVTFGPFVDDLVQGRARRVYASDEKPDLGRTPQAAWELIDFRDYESMLLQFSRGCPFDCEFCDIVRLNGKRQRTKGAIQFIREVDALYRRGWRGSVFVVDDNFIGVKARVTEMLEALTWWMDAHNRAFHFFTEASINLADDPDLMDLMVQAGFNKVFVGIETPEAQCLKEAGKAQNMKRDLLRSIRTIQAHGLEVMGGFIVGFDHDPDDIFSRQIEFIQKSGIAMAMVGLLEALKGTKLWKRLESEGRLLKDASGDNTDGILNFVPKMNRDTLLRGYHQILDTLYSPAAYYRRCMAFMRSCRIGRVSKVGWNGIVAFLRSIWRIGVRGDGGFRTYYWRLLAWTAVKRPRYFGEAVRLMIIGIHFRKWLEACTKRSPCLHEETLVSALEEAGRCRRRAGRGHDAAMPGIGRGSSGGADHATSTQNRGGMT